MAVCWSWTWRKNLRHRRSLFARTWRFYTVTGLSTGLMVARCQLGKERSKTQHCSKKKGFGARRSCASQLSECYDYYECGKHRSGAVWGFGRSNSHRRHVAQEFVFSGRTDCRRNATPAECRHSVSRRGRLRRPLWTQHAESLGGEGQSSDGGSRKKNCGRV